MTQILVLDDQPTAMIYWWDALAEAGYTVVQCSTTTEAIRHYNADHFDLVVLDRMMPPGEIFGKSEDPPTKETGSQVLKDVRDRRHLHAVPVIILTNYADDQAVEQLNQDYSRLKIVSKRTKPSELVSIVAAMLRERQMDRLPPLIPDDEYPDIAPYYVHDVGQEQKVRVYFERCAFEEHTHIFGSAKGERWDLAPVFTEWLSSTKTCHKVHKLLCHDYTDVRAIGLYWSGADKGKDDWYRNVLFVAAPWVKYGNDNRKLSGVGEVMVARYLREWLWRHGKLPEEPNFDAALFDEHGVDVEAATSSIPFLQALKFGQVKGTKLYRIGQQDAQQLLDRTTGYERSPPRSKD